MEPAPLPVFASAIAGVLVVAAFGITPTFPHFMAVVPAGIPTTRSALGTDPPVRFR